MMRGIPGILVIAFLSSLMAGCRGGADPVTPGIPEVSTASSVGKVSATNNPQVAQYSVTGASGSPVMVEFGVDTSYPFKTWTQPVSADGQVKVLVAGMKARTTYHMRAVTRLQDGTQSFDADHTFTTGGLPPARIPQVNVTQPGGPSPNGGVELLDLISNSTGAGVNNQVQVAAVDLQGNLVWYYDDPAIAAGVVPNPVKPLENGDFLVNYSGNGGDGSDSILREVDLAGNTVWQFNGPDLQRKLSQAGFDFPLIGTHHDVAVLPNGHLILIVSIQKAFNNLIGLPTTNVTGDGVVALDENKNPVWVWSAFDHLDVNRHPFMFPDWTHTNAVIYTPDDGNLILSIRHQNWIIKLDYQDGRGSGNILWKLGSGGDFELKGGIDPNDWFYAQHAPVITSPNSSGVFEMLLFDNGNDRIVDGSGDLCGGTGQPACYSKVPILQVDENARTAQIVWQDTLPSFSFFGGYAQEFSNNNIEFDESASSSTPPSASIFEVTQDPSPQLVLQMDVVGQYAYRAFRIPSLYPGVQW